MNISFGSTRSFLVYKYNIPRNSFSKLQAADFAFDILSGFTTSLLELQQTGGYKSGIVHQIKKHFLHYTD